MLDGGVQIAAGRVRVSARLIRVGDGQQMWAGQFDEQLRDIFSVQDSISDRVTAVLRIPLANRNRKVYTANIQAYQLYMKGNLHSRRLIREALMVFIKVDPKWDDLRSEQRFRQLMKRMKLE